MLFAQPSSLHSVFSHPSLILLFPSHSLLLRLPTWSDDLVVYLTWTGFHSRLLDAAFLTTDLDFQSPCCHTKSSSYNSDPQHKPHEELLYFLEESAGYKEIEAVCFPRSKAPLI